MAELPLDYFNKLASNIKSGAGDYFSSLAKRIANPDTTPNYGILETELHTEVSQMKDQGHPIQNVHRAIDASPQITDKAGAKSFAEKVYEGVYNVGKELSDFGGNSGIGKLGTSAAKGIYDVGKGLSNIGAAEHPQQMISDALWGAGKFVADTARKPVLEQAKDIGGASLGFGKGVVEAPLRLLNVPVASLLEQAGLKNDTSIQSQLKGLSEQYGPLTAFMAIAGQYAGDAAITSHIANNLALRPSQAAKYTKAQIQNALTENPKMTHYDVQDVVTKIKDQYAQAMGHPLSPAQSNAIDTMKKKLAPMYPYVKGPEFIHLTNPTNIESILKNGLKPNTSVGLEGGMDTGVYGSTSKEQSLGDLGPMMKNSGNDLTALRIRPDKVLDYNIEATNPREMIIRDGIKATDLEFYKNGKWLPLKDFSLKEFVNPTDTNALNSLAQEAQKYNSPEEFVNNAKGFATRNGKVDKNGAYFSTKGSSTYFDPLEAQSLDHSNRSGYDISSANLIKSSTTHEPNPEAAKLIQEALKDPANTAQDIVKLKRNADGFFDYHIVDEIPSVVRAAKKMGYDGIKLFEADDISDPSSVFIWNTNKAKSIGNPTDFYNKVKKK